MSTPTPATGWQPEYDGNIPVRVRWTGTPHRQTRPCPRTWPHDPHGPWFDGHMQAAGVVGFDCPGRPVSSKREAQR